MKRWFGLMLVPIALIGSADAAAALELRGSRASMQRQHGVAVENGYAFAKTPAQLRELVRDGRLVELESGADYDVSMVRYPYALPEVRTLIERLGAQYREATGDPLIVTSLSRPTSRQPANAHALSVHPAGMAIDLRVPRTAHSRQWLEDALLSLEARGVLDATRERYPPHYHVAVFPTEYAAYVEERLAAEAKEAAARAAEQLGVIQTLSPPAELASVTRAASGEESGWPRALLALLPLALLAVPGVRTRLSDALGRAAAGSTDSDTGSAAADA